MSSPNQNDSKKIVPDLPEMRSVLIRSSGPPQLTTPAAGRTEPYAKQGPILKNPLTIMKGSAPSQIKWNPDPLPKLPEMYPLERSHAYVKDVDCVEIASRIADCLQKESIAATFKENKAVAETACHTQFYVKLFEDHNQIIVEVQRSRGCSWKFSQCSKAVLCAAKGVKRRAPPNFKVPESVIAAKEMEDHTEAAIDLAFDMLNRPKVDTQLLAIESLEKMSRDGLIKVLSQDRLEKIVSLTSEAEHCRDALTLWANLLEHKAVDACKCTDAVQMLMTKLVDDDLHVAHQAARCLNYICKAVPDIKKLISKIGVAEAQMHGMERHSLLAEETKLLQMELEG